MTGDELHDGAERDPVDRDGVRRTIKTQYMLNSMSKGEPRHVGLSVDAFPFA